MRRVLSPEAFYEWYRQMSIIDQQTLRFTVLFVDDEQETLDSLRRSLLSEPYRQLFALSAAEALAIIARQEVHMVVSDINMPEMDGLSFLRQVRRLNPEIVRLVLSGTADLSTVIELINAGEIYRYIAKPVHLLKELRITLLQSVEYCQIKQQRRALLEELEGRNRELQLWQKKIERELALAGALQQKILSTDPYFHRHLEICSAYEPHILVGGDFYDVISLPEEQTCLYIGDVAGHGVAPAMLSMLLKVLIKETVRNTYREGPAAICNTIHQRFLQYVQDPESYATLFIAFFDPGSATWRCMNCGHPAPVITPAPVGVDLSRGGFPVGMAIAPAEICQPEDEIVLPASPGMSLVFFTDGLVEGSRLTPGASCDGRSLGEDLLASLEPLVLNPARRILNMVRNRGCDLRRDDCSILVARLIPPESLLFTGELGLDKAEVTNCGQTVQDLLRQRGWSMRSAWAARMVVHEYAMNIIDHAQLTAGSRFELRIRLSGPLCRILFLDAGREWDYPERCATLQELSPEAERGRGLALVGELCRDRLFFRREGLNHTLFTVEAGEDDEARRDE